MKSKQVILITGASSGIGLDAALQFLKMGHTVYGAARRIEKMEAIVKAGGHALSMDITQEADIIRVVAEIVSRQGKIDALINNAGYGLYGAMEDTNMEDARYQFDVNFFGLARLTQEVLPHMRMQKSGRIINLSSIAGKVYMPMGSWYHASKHALEGWSDCLRLELKKHGIQVVIIEPGVITTAFGDVMTDPLLERSASGPYSEIALGMAQSTDENYAKGASEPRVITALLIKAVESDKPNFRYTAGKLSWLAPFSRNFFGDRIFDMVLLKAVKDAYQRRIKIEAK